MKSAMASYDCRKLGDLIIATIFLPNILIHTSIAACANCRHGGYSFHVASCAPGRWAFALVRSCDSLCFSVLSYTSRYRDSGAALAHWKHATRQTSGSEARDSAAPTTPLPWSTAHSNTEASTNNGGFRPKGSRRVAASSLRCLERGGFGIATRRRQRFISHTCSSSDTTNTFNNSSSREQ